MGVLDGVVIVEGTVLEGEFGASHWLQWTFAMRYSQINLRTCLF